MPRHPLLSYELSLVWLNRQCEIALQIVQMYSWWSMSNYGSHVQTWAEIPSLVQIRTRLITDLPLLNCWCYLIAGGKTPDVKEQNKRTYADIMKEQNLRKEEVILYETTEFTYKIRCFCSLREHFAQCFSFLLKAKQCKGTKLEADLNPINDMISGLRTLAVSYFG